jgi:hypothetical protein
MKRHTLSSLLVLAIAVVAGAAVFDIAVIVTRPVLPWFRWLLP